MSMGKPAESEVQYFDMVD